MRDLLNSKLKKRRALCLIVLSVLMVGGIPGLWQRNPQKRDPQTPRSSARKLGETESLKSPPLRLDLGEGKLDGAAVLPRPGELLITQVEGLITTFEALQKVDSIDSLHQAAEIQNEFTALLNAKRAAYLVKKMPPDFLTKLFGDIALRRWADSDRKTAAEWMRQNPIDSPVAASALESGWFSQDPQGLDTYLAGLPQGAWRSDVARAAGEEALVAKSPSQALSLLDSIQGADARRDELSAWAVTAWASQDSAAATQYATAVGDYTLQEKLLAATAIGRASTDPAGAAQWLVANVADQDATRPAVEAIVRLWATTDPQSAANWISGFPAGPNQERAIDGMLDVWASINYDQAKAWQQSIADPALRQQALDGLKRNTFVVVADPSVAPGR